MPLGNGDFLETNMLLPIEACEALCAGIQAAMVHGLSTGPGQESDLKMLPAFVTNFPKGGEQGAFIALDLVSAAHRCPMFPHKKIATTAPAPSYRPKCFLNLSNVEDWGPQQLHKPLRPPSSDLIPISVILVPSLHLDTCQEYLPPAPP